MRSIHPHKWHLCESYPGEPGKKTVCNWKPAQGGAAYGRGISVDSTVPGQYAGYPHEAPSTVSCSRLLRSVFLNAEQRVESIPAPVPAWLSR